MALVERFNNGCCNWCDMTMVGYMMWEFWDEETHPLDESCWYCGLPWQLAPTPDFDEWYAVCLSIWRS